MGTTDSKDHQRTLGVALIFSGKAEPHALESEQIVLGAMLLSPIGRAVCVQELEPSDFYSSQHGILFRLMREMDDKGVVDLVTVYQRLAAEDRLAEVGDISYLTSLMNQVISPDTPDPHVAIVKAQSHRRRLIRQLREGMALAEDELQPVSEVQSAVEAKVFGVREPPKDDTDPVEWANTVETESALVSEGMDGRRRVKTGFKNIDDALRLWPKRVSILAGGTSQGKSAISIAIATNSALSLGQRTYYWSGEMDRTELWERICAARLNIKYELIQDRRLSDAERQQIKELAAQIKSASLIVRDDPKTITDIRADCRYIAKTKGAIELVVIDYLALLKDLNSEAEDRERRDVRIGIIVWNAIQIARELDSHVILLHQLNREKDKRATSRPRVSDLKDSSTIEQHAHNVLLVYLPERDENISQEQIDQYRKCMEFIIGKQRGGKVGFVWLHFDGDTQRVVNLDKQYWPKPVTVSTKRRGDG